MHEDSRRGSSVLPRNEHPKSAGEGETDLTAIVGDEMGDKDLRVVVVAVHSGWKK